MADLIMHHIDYALATDLYFLLICIGVRNPVQRLLRRRDIISPACKDNNWRSDRLNIQSSAPFNIGFAARELVANKKLLNNPSDLCFIHKMIAAPPAFKFKKTLFSIFRVVKKIIIFAKIISAWIEHFEIRNKISAVKLSITQI